MRQKREREREREREEIGFDSRDAAAAAAPASTVAVHPWLFHLGRKTDAGQAKMDGTDRGRGREGGGT